MTNTQYLLHVIDGRGILLRYHPNPSEQENDIVMTKDVLDFLDAEDIPYEREELNTIHINPQTDSQAVAMKLRWGF
ncbi:hypothetical protein [Microvirga pudoricolor]|uniref:hypothetical protein n=1 Tax=Microvirga pudoricolor TaxID=2778729 RepID=UPI00195243E2|nr:hypothetical protein [Microvirga pudoricolor]MBM6595566.1 hypothetical protein [Microvirga pudoricolor]